MGLWGRYQVYDEKGCEITTRNNNDKFVLRFLPVAMFCLCVTVIVEKGIDHWLN